MAKPDDVTDIDTWLYNHKKGNIVLGDDGSMMVLDQKTKDPKAPVKTIPFKKGIDAFTVLAQPLHPHFEPLRAAALEKMDELNTLRQGAVDTAYAAVVAADKQYIEAVDAWEAEKNPMHSMAVVEASTVLAKAEEEYRKAMYPHRKLDTLSLLRNQVDYRTKDERAYPFQTVLEVYNTTTAVERSVPILDKA
jgi:hypothetical protein